MKWCIAKLNDKYILTTEEGLAENKDYKFAELAHEFEAKGLKNAWNYKEEWVERNVK